MEQKEQEWDRLLKIRTSGRDDSHSDQYYYPYEPTPYCVLERLAQSGWIGKKHTLADYGTGKGRVCFFLSRQTGCRSVGIEYDERIYARAMENRNAAVSAGRVSFVLEDAQKYPVGEEINRCYFFNPFSVEILQKVLARIEASYYENPREILLFFYYPSEEYISLLMTRETLMFVDEIDCTDLFPGKDAREKILIFQLGEGEGMWQQEL